MLQNLTIQNYQKHESISIDLERINVLVGETDQGKSSILRCLEWICTNEPKGEAFRRHGAKYVKGKLIVDEHTIVRKRGKRNSYSLDGNTYYAFGNGVPESISSLLNIGEVNFQGQHDSPFWLTLSPGQVSRELNEIINLGLIDSVMSSIASDLRKAKARVEVSKDRLKEARERRKSLQWSRDFNSDLVKLETLNKDIEEKKTKTLLLRKTVEDVSLYAQKLDRSSNAILDTAKLCSIGDRLLKTRDKYTILIFLTEQVNSCQEKAKSAREGVIALQEELTEQSKGYCPVCGGNLRNS